MNGPTFQKRHYQRIASLLKEIALRDGSYDKVAIMAQDFSRVFKNDNPLFDEGRFFDAVGFPPHFWIMPKSP